MTKDGIYFHNKYGLKKVGRNSEVEGGLIKTWSFVDLKIRECPLPPCVTLCLPKITRTHHTFYIPFDRQGMKNMSCKCCSEKDIDLELEMPP